MKTLLISLTLLFCFSLTDANAVGKRPKRSSLTKKIVWQGEKPYKKNRYKPVTITSKMFAGENIRKFGASSKF